MVMGLVMEMHIQKILLAPFGDFDKNGNLVSQDIYIQQSSKVQNANKYLNPLKLHHTCVCVRVWLDWLAGELADKCWLLSQ